MGYYINVQFSFRCHSIKQLKKVAKTTLAALSCINEDELSYTQIMLQQIVENPNKYVHIGNKGDMFIWGGVWNYYSTTKELPQLKQFYYDCLENKKILFDYDKALLFVSKEQIDKTAIYELSYDNAGYTTIKQAVSELSWNQC